MLQEIKDRIRQAQLKAVMSVNTEMLLMYWDVGRIIAERRSAEGWGTKIIQRLARDIRNELPEIKGFSERNLKRMSFFYNEYAELQIGPPVVAQLPAESGTAHNSQLLKLALRLPWAHNILLLGLKNRAARLWYMEQTLKHGWSKRQLEDHIKHQNHERHGKAVTNFSGQLPSSQSALAQEALKDPYIFDFLTLEEPFHERELETGLVAHVEKFLLELGAGFAFLGRQYHLTVSDQDFYIDLLFYHTKLRCYVVVELKSGKFKPEYAGKVNFYCTAVDEILRHDQDNPTIGLILCQTNDRIIAEYALKKVNTPIGVSEYELTRALPENLKSSLPTIEEIEDQLEENI